MNFESRVFCEFESGVSQQSCFDDKAVSTAENEIFHSFARLESCVLWQDLVELRGFIGAGLAEQLFLFFKHLWRNARFL